MEFTPKDPVEIKKVIVDVNPIGESFRSSVGKFVSIRPCAEEHENKSFLGLYVCDLNLHASVSHDPKTGILKVESSLGNPAIFVFDLNKIVMGCESWWGVIKSEDQLRKITDYDINNLWYVKAMKQLAEEADKEEEESEVESPFPTPDETGSRNE